MIFKRKSISIFALVVVITVFLLTSCTKQVGMDEKSEASSPQAGKKLVTVTTSFLSDMVENLAGDLVDIETIIPAGDDPHMYLAKPDDLKKIDRADLLLYHGLHFEGKMIEVLERFGKSVSEGFKEDETGRMEEDGQTVVDPHFWFDIPLYKKASQNACSYLVKLLPEKKETLEKNLAAYLEKLDRLNEDNKRMLEEIPKENRYLVTPHDAFNYFSRLYNIEVVAPQGVSTDSEVSNKDIEKTADFIVSHKVKAIFAESTTNPERMKKLQELCKTKGFEVKVVEGEGQELFSDSLAPKGEKGDNYIDMYKHNIELIRENLK